MDSKHYVYVDGALTNNTRNDFMSAFEVAKKFIDADHCQVIIATRAGTVLFQHDAARDNCRTRAARIAAARGAAAAEDTRQSLR